MKYFFSVLGLLCIIFQGHAQREIILEPDWDIRIGVEITELMNQQEKCWNQSDLDGFMLTYWHNDSLMFIGKSGITYGWQKTLDNYKKGYPDKKAMGVLTFTNIKIIPLSPTSCYVIGRWELKRSIGDLSGHYTLLWNLIDKKWKIVSDHSS